MTVLHRLRTHLNQATPTPWLAIHPKRGMVVSRHGEVPMYDPQRDDADAALIVALVNQAHTLLDIVEAAREACSHLGSQRPEIAALEAALARLDQKQTP